MVLRDVEECGIAPTRTTLEVLGEIALGDPHAFGDFGAALIDHHVGKT